jgi:hypothetical protein
MEHDRAAMRVDPHQPLGLQLRESLADGRRAHTEPLRDVVLAESRTGGERSVLDLIPEAFRDDLRGGVSSERVLSVRHISRRSR